MNRRELLKGMLALPAAGLPGGWEQYKPAPSALPGSPTASSGNKLAVILQGPFAVVLRKNKSYGVNAFVPKIRDGDKVQHEFRFLSPHEEPALHCETGHRFELRKDGLALGSRGEPKIDRAFDNVQFAIEKWAPDLDDYFLSLDLPAPDAITYIPPLYPALFNLSNDPDRNSWAGSNGLAGRPGYVPLNHVLEYSLSDAKSVDLIRHSSSHCENKKEKDGKHHRPLSSKELLEDYEKHYGVPDQMPNPAFSQWRYIAHWLEQYSHVFFLGVGVPPDPDPSSHMRERAAHGVDFFNRRLLPAVLQTDTPPEGLKLVKVGRDALPCETVNSLSSAPAIRPAVWQPLNHPPRLVYVTSTENCTAPAATAIATSG